MCFVICLFFLVNTDFTEIIPFSKLTGFFFFIYGVLFSIPVLRAELADSEARFNKTPYRKLPSASEQIRRRR